jgi:signal transduction histidine kinase
MQTLLQTMEQQVTERTAELTQANAELEATLQELKQTQVQLIQTEKMSSLGQLVAGIAHEINNPVNFIHGNLPYANQYTQDLLKLVQLYQKHYPAPVPEIQSTLQVLDLDFLIEDLTKLLASIQMGTDRIKQIILSLRNFSRMDEAEMKLVNIHEGIDSTLMILQHRIRPRSGQPIIHICKQYGSIRPVECYPSQLNQVFMNILANAIDALDENPKFSESQPSASPSLETKIQTALQRTHPTSTPNDQNQPMIWIRTEMVGRDQVAITIADNGSGIPESLKHRLFDPFFTTKPIGKGTGLGLSISYQIVKGRHNGSLKCSSSPGLGTEFVITIPVRQKGEYS